MAISGDISIPVLGTSVTLTGKYMRLRQITVNNAWGTVAVEQPLGGDGLPVSPQLVPKQIYEVSGILDVYHASSDPAAGIPPIEGATRQYKCAYDPKSSENAQAQLYAFIMTQLPDGSVLV